jgi:mannose-6-phosphate isomerase-like protein (cupin superfamily)
MPKIHSPEELPHWISTRDKRKRLDLVNEVIQGTTLIKGDKIYYPPDNAGSAHWHRDAVEVKYILRGSATFIIDDQAYEVREGHALLLKPGEVHHNKTSPDEELEFVEFWVPPAQVSDWVNTRDP